MTWRLAGLLAIGVAMPLTAQGRLQGVVVDSAGHAPLEQARVTIERGRGTVTDRFGRFSLVLDRLPARLIVGRIGFAPDTVEVTELSGSLLRIALHARTIQLTDLVVAAGELDPGLNELGRWTVPLANTIIPAAVAPDLLRDLSTVPAVTQSTVLSARPIVRGYDPGEITLRLDGFDLPNPYHIARAFSSVPVEVAERVSVATAPLDVTVGGTSGAAVDIVGRTGEAGEIGGGAALTPITLDAWAHGGTDGIRFFGAGRAATVGTIARAAGTNFNYGFHDGYAGLLGVRNGSPWLRLTAFGSHDQVDDAEGGDAMQWGVGLIGLRADLWRHGGQRLEILAHVTDFDETVDHLQVSRGFIDVRNEFSRAGGGAEWSSTGGRGRLLLGATAAARQITNEVEVSGGSLLPVAMHSSLTELGAYGSVSPMFGSAMIDLGLRYDGAGNAHAWQPRLRGEVPVGGGWSLGMGLGRSARLYHSVSDPSSEPEVVFYDLWFVAGENGIPVAQVDHAMFSANWHDERFSFRAAAYASSGTGMVEVRPETDQAPGDVLRIGDSRTHGVELQGGMSRGIRSFTLTYALTWSERDWGGGWIPWIQDRRHLLRLAAQTGIGGRWRLSAMAEGMSAAPLTPVAYVVPVDPIYIYGPEGSARGNGTFRLDLGVERPFGGRTGVRGAFTASITNLTFGPVAPLVPEEPGTLYPYPGEPTHEVRYVRSFDMPAVPTIGLRLEF